MTGINQFVSVGSVANSTPPEAIHLGFKPKVAFAMGAGIDSTSPTWVGAPAYAGFGWSPDPTTGEQTSVASGGGAPGGNWGGCTISESLYSAQFEATNLQAKTIDMVTYDCDPASGHPNSGYTWQKHTSTYFAQKLGRIVLGGSGISVKTGSFAWPASSGNYVVSGLGFRPQLVMFLWSKQNSYNKGYTFGSTAGSGFGFGAASDATQQFCHYCSSEYLASGVDGVHMTGRVIQAAGGSGFGNSASLVSLDADGFTLNFTGNGSEPRCDTDRLIGWIALRDVKGGFHVGLHTAKTSTGSQSYTGCGFRPDQVITHHGNSPAANTHYPARGSFGMGMFDDTLAQMSILNGELLAGGNSGRYQTLGACLSFAAAANATVVAEAAVTSMDADGFTLNWTAANGTAYPWGYIAMKTTGGNAGCGRAVFMPKIYRRLTLT